MTNQYAETTAAPVLEWRAPETFPDNVRPCSLWPWLVETESLTARLRARCPTGFRVRVLSSGDADLTADEAEWTGRSHGFLREVHLCCGETPWVYARTLVMNGGDSEARLRGLGEKPLGDWAFEQDATWRDALEVARLDHAALPAALAEEVALWGRRSVLRTGDDALYISEYFLDGVTTPWR